MRRRDHEDMEWYISPNDRMYLKVGTNGNFLFGNIGGHDVELISKNFNLVSKQIGDRNAKNVIEAMGWKELKGVIPKEKIEKIEETATRFYNDNKGDEDYEFEHAGEQFSELVDMFRNGSISDKFIGFATKGEPLEELV